MPKTTKILVTGAAGFIGHALCMHLHQRSNGDLAITATDSHSLRWQERLRLLAKTRCDWEFLDVCNIRQSRIQRLKRAESVQLRWLDMTDKKKTMQLLQELQPTIVFHFAALPKVLPSMDAPADYILNNSYLFAGLMEACHACGSVEHLLLASSSSVYGDGSDMQEDSPLPPPDNFYAATKQMDESTAKLYGSRHNIPVTAMRFFTVYGEWGRADMAMHRTISACVEGRTFRLNGDGSSTRSFVFVDDIAEAMHRLMPLPPTAEQNHFRAINIGLEHSYSMRDLMECVESAAAAAGAPSLRVEQLPFNTAEAAHTKADCTLLRELTGYTPQTSLQDGVQKCMDWYMEWRRDGR